jgi:polyvinyl alcohol dehydrogenase (cytochrome)
MASITAGLMLLAACSGAPPTGIADTPPSSNPPAASPAPPTTDADWPTYHRDNARTGTNPQVAPVGRLGTAWNARLDGAVYGQPLVLGDRVIAATENDTVYALAASDGHVLWSAHLGTPAAKSSLPCGDIDPLGITGTPAYDQATGLVFAVAETGGGHHTLAGIDVTSGAVRLHRPVEPPQGNAIAHQQRAALTVLDGQVYIAFGGLFGDCDTYFGSVVSAPTTGLGPLHGFAVPTPGKAGIWAPGGAVVAGGNLLYAVGNGDSETTYDHSDSVLALTPQLTIADSFSPAEWMQDNDQDLDLGSMSPALVGDFVYSAGKRGVGYVLRAGRLGGIAGQVAQHQVCRAFGASAVTASTVYLPCTDGTTAVAISASGQPSVLWKTPVRANGSPVVGGGAIWTVDTSQGVLYALDPASGIPHQQISLGALPHFASPTVVRDRAYVGTMNGVAAISGA